MHKTTSSVLNIILCAGHGSRARLNNTLKCLKQLPENRSSLSCLLEQFYRFFPDFHTVIVGGNQFPILRQAMDENKSLHQFQSTVSLHDASPDWQRGPLLSFYSTNKMLAGLNNPEQILRAWPGDTIFHTDYYLFLQQRSEILQKTESSQIHLFFSTKTNHSVFQITEYLSSFGILPYNPKNQSKSLLIYQIPPLPMNKYVEIFKEGLFTQIPMIQTPNTIFQKIEEFLEFIEKDHPANSSSELKLLNFIMEYPHQLPILLHLMPTDMILSQDFDTAEDFQEYNKRKN